MYPAMLGVLILVCVFIYIHTLCMLARKAPVSLHICPGSPEPSLLDNAMGKVPKYHIHVLVQLADLTLYYIITPFDAFEISAKYQKILLICCLPW